jgi:Effector protein
MCEASCKTEKPTDWKAGREYEAFARKIEVLLKKQRPADAPDLLNPRNKRIGSFMNVVVRYFEFPVWLARYDPKLSRGLDVNIRSYRFQRDRHQEDVVKEFLKLRVTDTGKALLNEIENTQHTLHILPFLRFGLYATEFFRPLGLNATAQGGRREPGVAGTDAYISFTASMWGPATAVDPTDMTSRGTAGQTGPGSHADEVLFHEMVHGARTMRGVAEAAHNRKVDQGYSNEEEYITVVVSNIYLAEKKQRHLRESHSGFGRLPRPEAFLTNPQNVNLHPKDLLRNFRAAQQSFFDGLADIPPSKAWWNPVREIKPALAS